MPDSGKKSYATRVTPQIIRSVKAIYSSHYSWRSFSWFGLRVLLLSIYYFQVVADAEMRAACLQVLFTVAYNLKSLISPWSKDLLNIALNSLKQGSQKVSPSDDVWFWLATGRGCWCWRFGLLLAGEDGRCEAAHVSNGEWRRGGREHIRWVIRGNHVTQKPLFYRSFCRSKANVSPASSVFNFSLDLVSSSS